jgi:hypothetical protein
MKLLVAAFRRLESWSSTAKFAGDCIQNETPLARQEAPSLSSEVMCIANVELVMVCEVHSSRRSCSRRVKELKVRRVREKSSKK